MFNRGKGQGDGDSSDLTERFRRFAARQLAQESDAPSPDHDEPPVPAASPEGPPRFYSTRGRLLRPDGDGPPGPASPEPAAAQLAPQPPVAPPDDPWEMPIAAPEPLHAPPVVAAPDTPWVSRASRAEPLDVAESAPAQPSLADATTPAAAPDPYAFVDQRSTGEGATGWPAADAAEQHPAGDDDDYPILLRRPAPQPDAPSNTPDETHAWPAGHDPWSQLHRDDGPATPWSSVSTSQAAPADSDAAPDAPLAGAPSTPLSVVPSASGWPDAPDSDEQDDAAPPRGARDPAAVDPSAGTSTASASDPWQSPERGWAAALPTAWTVEPAVGAPEPPDPAAPGSESPAGAQPDASSDAAAANEPAAASDPPVWQLRDTPDARPSAAGPVEPEPVDSTAATGVAAGFADHGTDTGEAHTGDQSQVRTVVPSQWPVSNGFAPPPRPSARTSPPSEWTMAAARALREGEAGGAAASGDQPATDAASAAPPGEPPTSTAFAAFARDWQRDNAQQAMQTAAALAVEEPPEQPVGVRARLRGLFGRGGSQADDGASDLANETEPDEAAAEMGGRVSSLRHSVLVRAQDESEHTSVAAGLATHVRRNWLRETPDPLAIGAAVAIALAVGLVLIALLFRHGQKQANSAAQGGTRLAAQTATAAPTPHATFTPAPVFVAPTVPPLTPAPAASVVAIVPPPSVRANPTPAAAAIAPAAVPPATQPQTRPARSAPFQPPAAANAAVSNTAPPPANNLLPALVANAPTLPAPPPATGPASVPAAVTSANSVPPPAFSQPSSSGGGGGAASGSSGGGGSVAPVTAAAAPASPQEVGSTLNSLAAQASRAAAAAGQRTGTAKPGQ